MATRKHGDRAAWLQLNGDTSAVATTTNEHNLDFAIHAQQNLVMAREQKARRPRRPPRLGRLFDNAPPLYFITFNSYRRRPLLARPEVHKTFQTFCFNAQEHDVAVGRYVIMPDHIHLFVAFPRVGITLPSWTGSLRNIIGKRLLQLGISKPHWQDGFFDHLLRSGESYSQKWDYVRMNPVRAKLCATPETWPYQGEILWLPFD